VSVVRSEEHAMGAIGDAQRTKRQEIRCENCGYGAVVDRKPTRCPMCGNGSFAHPTRS
jgi:rubrerythrin